MKVIIGGSGRSGTSLLSRMFIELGAGGLDEIPPEYINDSISAGCEASLKQCLDFLNSDSSGVIKTPWLYELAHSSEFNRENIDLIILPIRDPVIATMSRLINELSEICFASSNPSFNQSYGYINAGNHYFTDLQENSRTLSTAVTSLIHQALIKNIRISFVPFPEIENRKIAEDWLSSISDILNSLNISVYDASEWIATHFDAGLLIENRQVEAFETFKDYKNFMNGEINGHPNTQAFIMAHMKYIRHIKRTMTEHHEPDSESIWRKRLKRLIKRRQ